MADVTKLSEVEAKIKLRSNISDLLTLAHALCRSGQSIEDFVGILNLSLQNDLMLSMVMDKLAAKE